MSEIPHAVLSDKFQELMSGRRLKAAVFLTFTFEPDFFEQEILPSVMPDMPRSQVTAIRLLQLEDALKGIEHLAVYYDRAGLIAGAESAKLDVRRIPTHHRTGCFHPKNVFLLTESAEPGESGTRETRLIVASLSANLTRAGWWENVEACHIEDLGDREPCAFREDLLELIRLVKTASYSESEHYALEAVKKFVLRLERRQNRRSNGVLYPQLYCGRNSVDEFLSHYLGAKGDDAYLEVISPFFNKADFEPLSLVCGKFKLREVRVFLPRRESGAAQCEKELYDALKSIPNAHWARLPSELTRAGKQEQTKHRRVHAKVYRFFTPRSRYEALFVGSVNLTTSAHSGSGNLESAFLVETNPNHPPDWWLELDSSRPSLFQPIEDDESAVTQSHLMLRFNWSTKSGRAFWDATSSSGIATVSAQGAPLFELTGLPPREWTALSASDRDALHRVLGSTSFVNVSEDNGPDALILVQEEGMSHKPSLLTSFSAADILRWWTLLTVEQRAAAFEDKYESIPEALLQLGIDTPPMLPIPASLFASFAGIYHAFGSLEKSIREALDEKRTRDAEYRLLGNKYDSLPNLLDRLKQPSERDDIEKYIIALCAQQTVDSIADAFPWFVNANRRSFRSLRAQIREARKIGSQLRIETSSGGSDFIQWFEQWFLRRALAGREV
jgi:hypothetical protein